MYYTIVPSVLQYYMYDGTPHVYIEGDPQGPPCAHQENQLASEYFTLKHADNVSLLGICMVYLTKVTRFIGQTRRCVGTHLPLHDGEASHVNSVFQYDIPVTAHTASDLAV